MGDRKCRLCGLRVGFGDATCCCNEDPEVYEDICDRKDALIERAMDMLTRTLGDCADYPSDIEVVEFITALREELSHDQD